MSETTELDKRFVASTYGRFPVELVSGQGSVVTDSAGKSYIDMGSGIAVNAFGIADPAWKAAVTSQLDRLQHASNLYYTEPCARLAALLCQKTGMERVFFGNSGAEANECAVKVMRRYAAQRHGTGPDGLPVRHKVVTLVNSFHGRTLTTLAATGQDHFHELFQPLTPGFVHVPANDLSALEAVVAQGDVAGILMECVQGEGGVIALDAGFVRGAAALAAREDIVLGIDEVQTGNGRSGWFYSYMAFGIEPDVVSTAKGLGGGLPIGACLMGHKVADVLGPGDHGSTFGGNPVCCAGALSVVERIDEALLEEVRRKGAHAVEVLGAAPGIVSVTGMGLMLGLETVKPARQVVDECMDKGVLCLTAKAKVRLLPALNIPDDLLDDALSVIVDACAS